MNDIYASLKGIADDPNARGVLVEIESTTGSSPRKTGARMLLTPDGGLSGTVGGGTLEYRAERDARTVLESGVPLRKTYSLGAGPGEATGAICGGSATLIFRPIGAQDADALLREKPNPPRILLYGAGHVGKALADTLHLLNMAVVVSDARPELLTEERFPYAERRLLPAEEEAAVDAGPDDLVAIMTHSHAFDYDLTLQALRSPAPYVGLIGSRRKVAQFQRRLLDDGMSPTDIETRLHSPIGLSIGAETPEEIAVSIAAELIRFLHQDQ